MRSSLLMFLVLISGCSTYSEIDSSIWNSFDKTYKNFVVSFKLPAGHLEKKPLATEEYLGLASFHYDVLSGTGRYGVPIGETEIDLIVLRVKDQQLQSHIDQRMKTDLKNCINDKYLSWDKITCESSRHIVLFHLKQLYPGEILYIVTRISRAAYKKKKIREQRLRMFEDIMNTVTVKNA